MRVSMCFSALTTLVMRWRIRLGLLPSRTATYDNNLYLCGLVIYVGTFVAASNWDYRLVFLALCIPKLTTVTSGAVRRWHTGLLVAILLALNYRVLHDILGVAGVALNLGAKLWLFVDALAVLLMLASQAMQSGTKYLRSQS